VVCDATFERRHTCQVHITRLRLDDISKTDIPHFLAIDVCPGKRFFDDCRPKLRGGIRRQRTTKITDGRSYATDYYDFTTTALHS
jgi:hypothetical protein